MAWLVKDKHVPASKSKALKEELFTLKYLASNSMFVRELAKEHAKLLPNGEALLVQKPAAPRKRGRPKLSETKRRK